MAIQDKNQAADNENRLDPQKVTNVAHANASQATDGNEKHDNGDNEPTHMSTDSWLKGWWRKWKEGSAADQAMVVLTVMFIVVTIPLVIFGYCQVELSRDALRNQRQQDSINTVSQTIRDSLNAQAVQFGNRAFVVVDFEYTPEIRDSLVWIKFNLSNVGKTPAYQVADSGTFYTQEIAESTITRIKDSMYKKITGMIIGKSPKVRTWYSLKMSKDSLDQIKNGKLALYIYTAIVYTDIFQQQRFTEAYIRYSLKPPLYNYIDIHNSAN